MKNTFLFKPLCVILFLIFSIPIISFKANPKFISDGQHVNEDTINKLYWLYISKDTFQTWYAKHKTKIMFRFTFSNNEISLTGWAPDKNNDDNDDYDTMDTLEAKPCFDPIALPSDKIYFGNIRLTKDAARKINDALNTSSYVLFKPVLYSKNSLNISYEISVIPSLTDSSNREQLWLDTEKTAPLTADPSPPANRR